jgi:broad specificity phosphatase PhoE
MTCHAESEYNAFMDGKIKTKDFTDCSLSKDGLERIYENKKTLLDKMHPKMDIVFLSPYKRCIETCLETYKDKTNIPSMYAMSLLTDSLDTPECVGTTQNELENNPKYEYIDFKEVFNEKNPNKEWYDYNFRRGISTRMKLFEDFLVENKEELINKNIQVITHSTFMQQITQKPVDYYQSYSLSFDTKEKKWKPNWRSIRPLF